MSLLQYSNIDDAFMPLSKKKKEKKIPEEEYTTPPPPPPPPQNEPTSFVNEISHVQPYLNNLFMLLVLGMLYDIRQAVLDCKIFLSKSKSD